jgi:hypothetical protein
MGYMAPGSTGSDDLADIDKQLRSILGEEGGVVTAARQPADEIKTVRRRMAQLAARESALRDALGGETPTPVLLREMRRDQQLGQQLFSRLVDQAAAERVRAQGPDYGVERYKAHLMQARDTDGNLDIEFVEGEVATWRAAKEMRYTPGRQVTPAAVPAATAADRKRAPAAPQSTIGDDDNLLR